ncbi:SGNH/GDSL hydrolase family protein [Nocardia sp. CNY236]|uniref:SGNH/GDSL hydrolase family protein n=1 Tax=Nocardia sp. CNY236 TaxID=1169152 RepID=UPI00041F0DA7|nr:SGNH/GDSL hydrolase family protein [Nocardia sp. CNY236]
MRSAVRALAVASMIGVALAATSFSSAAPMSAFAEYVALGDSWAADVTFSQTTSEFVPLGCVQSRSSYAKQVADALAVPKFRDAACDSATTVEMTAPQITPAGVNAPQFDRLSPTTDLVSMEIGGNDAGLAAAVRQCVTADPAVSPCHDTFVVDGVDRMSANVAASEPKVVAAILGIRARSPHARIVLLDYLQGVSIGPGCYPSIPISPIDAEWLGRKLVELNAMLSRAAAVAGVQFVDTYTSSAGHDACQPMGTRWVEGLVPYSAHPMGPAVPFHPNQLGADHQARMLLAALGR